MANGTPDDVCARILATRGMPAQIAEACGIKRQAVYQWKRVPPHWVNIVADILKLPPEKIRPDIFKSRKR